MAAPSDVVTPELAATGYDAQQRRPGQQYRLSLEEMRVLRECSRESFYYRCLPLAATASVAVHYAVKTGYLAPHPRYGSSLKVIGACFVSWIVGKFSYQRKCEEKLMQLPGSAVGEALRRKYGYAALESPPVSQSSDGYDLSVAEPRYASRDHGTSSGAPSLDVEKSARYQGLDDSQRPSLDYTPVAQEAEQTPPPRQTTTYEELRNRNREEYERRHPGSRAPYAPSPPRLESREDRERRTPSAAAPIPAQSTGTKKNLYGDTWDD